MLKQLKLFLFIFLVAVNTNSQADVTSDYRLGTGDKVNIKVFGEEELSAEFTLSDAGTISYPFLGEINALDKTTGELSNLISQMLADGYIVNPSINVEVITYREFYINGEIENPGAYPYQPGLTLQKAVAMAGGYTERASSSKMYVIRDDSSRTKIKNNHEIFPGDVITVDESFF